MIIFIIFLLVLMGKEGIIEVNKSGINEILQSKISDKI